MKEKRKGGSGDGHNYMMKLLEIGIFFFCIDTASEPIIFFNEVLKHYLENTTWIHSSFHT